MPKASPSASPDSPGGPDSATVGFVTRRALRFGLLALWIVVLVVSAGFAGKLGPVEKNDTASWLPTHAESTKVVDLQEAFTSRDPIPAVVVYERAAGLTDADKAKVAADAKSFATRKDLNGPVQGPTWSKDGTAAQVVVPLDIGTDYLNKAGGVVKKMREQAANGAGGMTTHIAGPAGGYADIGNSVNGADQALLFTTVLVVVAILLLTYRSPLLWLLPIVCSGIALTVAQAVIYALAKNGTVTVSADGSFILTILVFGASTDYALLLIARYREELRRHADRYAAMGVALRRTAGAVVASAATVAVSMMCLLAADMRSTAGLGPVFAIGVVCGLVTMLTLFPVLLVLCGRWIFWPRRPEFGSQDTAATGGLWARLGDAVAKRRRTTWVATALVLGALALGVVQLKPVGLTDEQSFRGAHDSVAGEKVLAAHFEVGTGSPLVIISTTGAADRARQAVAGTPGVVAASLTSPVTKGGHTYFEATMSMSPDSQAAYKTVTRVRDHVHTAVGDQAQVGGETALKLDTSHASRHDRNLITPLVLLVVFLVLMLLLRSVVAPLVLITTVALSFGAALGASALLYRHVFDFGAEDPTYPLYTFVFLIALGVDYNIFLMTRVREESVRHGTRRAARIGLAVTGGVITSAGLVLAGTFATLASLPVTLITELGLTVAIGVLLDTFIVRSVLVTALTLEIGRFMWWPSALFRRRDEPEHDGVRPPAAGRLPEPHGPGVSVPSTAEE
ncbi:MAG: MMPL family transporter [Streptomyces sp.]|nr:MMPL family transporter [Streptomyces sp.]NUS17301.1 MMPL family transporter [Streptomyces sp.]